MYAYPHTLTLSASYCLRTHSHPQRVHRRLRPRPPRRRRRRRRRLRPLSLPPMCVHARLANVSSHWLVLPGAAFFFAAFPGFFGVPVMVVVVAAAAVVVKYRPRESSVVVVRFVMLISQRFNTHAFMLSLYMSTSFYRRHDTVPARSSTRLPRPAPSRPLLLPLRLPLLPQPPRLLPPPHLSWCTRTRPQF